MMPEITTSDDGTVLIDGVPFDPEIHEIGWQVLDEHGNVVANGPIVVAEMASEMAEMLGLDLGE